MNINSIRNAIATNFKLKPKKKATKDAGAKNLANSSAKNSAETKNETSLALSASAFSELEADYLPKGSENNNWSENPDLEFYFNASKYPATKGVYVDIYA